nr:reverse transcriptase domain-containing protein [Tanacetum cinerariifolium]
MAIFHDMIKETMKVFIDDFSVFEDSFSSCLSYLDKMLKSHKISKSWIKVDRAKVDVTAKLPHPTTVKEKETPFIFSKECTEAFEILKKKLTKAPILAAPDWDLPFEIMCDASDFVVGAVGTGNSFTYDIIPESFNEVQVIPNPPPQCHFNIYLCQICESNSHYVYECSQRIPVFYDDDDDYNSAITPNEPVDSLSMEDEHLDTIPATKSDEFIKSCVENLVPNPSESEGENGCDVPACFTTFSNILFDVEYEFDSVDDQTLLNHDSSIIYSSSKIDSLLDEFAGELTLLKLIPSRVDETDCYPEEDIRLIERLFYDNSSPRPPKEFVNEYSNADIESFSPSPIPIKDSNSFMEEMDLTFTSDDPMPPGIEEDDDDSKRDILIREELLDNHSLSHLENESFRFDIPSFSRPPAKPPDGNTRILNIKMMGDNSKQKVSMPGRMITHVSNQEKSPDLLPHRSLENF